MNIGATAAQCVLLFVSVTAFGCGQQAASPSMSMVMERASSDEAAVESEVALVAGTGTPARSTINRKIIYTADIDLVVKNFGEFESEIPNVIAKHGGFVAERTTDRRHGNRRGGNWVIRVPVSSYDAFLSGLSATGFARRVSETSDDVTEAYVDLEARISNKRKLEERIIAMLDERPGKLTDLMALERELSRVREEIERMVGRLRVLTDQTSLATVKLAVTEEATYEPPTAPTLGDRIAGAWSHSIGGIGDLASGLIIVFVALLPWIAIAVPLALLAYRFWTRSTMRRTVGP